MSNNFRKTALLKKNINCNKATKQRIVLKNLGAYLCLNFSRGLLSIFHVIFPGTFLITDTCIENFTKWF